MKGFIIGSAMALLSLTVFGQINQTDAQGRKQGKWIKLYPNSKVIDYQGEFKNGKPFGTFTYNYVSNKRKAILVHTLNATRSKATFFYENGIVMSEGIYKNLKKDSIWASYNENGRLTMTETYKDDQLNGIKNLYYLPSDPEDKSQICISSYNYVNGKVEGKFTEWYPTKGLRKTGQFKNFVRHGEWVDYELNGIKIASTRFVNGKKHGWTIGYDKSGKEAQRSYYHFGKLVQGEALTKLMKEMKEKGINPNGED